MAFLRFMSTTALFSAVYFHLPGRCIGSFILAASGVAV
jgi:hypothetical protein